MRALSASKVMPIHDLPFVARDNRGAGHHPLNFWAPPPASSWLEGSDTQRGARFALEAIRAMQAANFPPLLGWIAMDMAARGIFGDLEISFFQTISERIEVLS